MMSVNISLKEFRIKITTYCSGSGKIRVVGKYSQAFADYNGPKGDPPCSPREAMTREP